MKAARKFVCFAVLFTVAAVILANPRKPPMKFCGNCGAGNEPDRTSCISCRARL